ncbi:hypothetical protein [Corynebacterium oculi]|uniref:Uncharacterized protein n=1 Tax=Corynebacterium oculi TaxID=1544416 RepID=A0A0Q1ABR6_9CORY|nr:hypothetical protein [Corynebacterium oculi]KQB84088.1 hypothetical protein Cocul_00884 [Corynebacterium oculi]
MVGTATVFCCGGLFFSASVLFWLRAQVCVSATVKLVRGAIDQETWLGHVETFFAALRWLRTAVVVVVFVVLCSWLVVTVAFVLAQMSGSQVMRVDIVPSMWAVSMTAVMVCLGVGMLWIGDQRWDYSEKIVTGEKSLGESRECSFLLPKNIYE